MAIRAVIVALIILNCIGCGEPYSHLDSVVASDELHTAFESKDHLFFLSWDGIWKGTDIDTELTLFPDGTVKITYCGTSLDSVTGTYSTDGSIISVSVDLSKLVEMPGGEDWPQLRLKRDGDDLLLVPVRKTTALYHFNGKSSGWPLRSK